MNKKRIVIALGGNALGNSLAEQMKAVKITAKAIVDLIEEKYEVLIVHGNGPQVGMINNAMSEYAANHAGTKGIPLSVCGAMSQAYIGYDLQNSLREEFLDRGLSAPPIATLITQVRVDADDPAFRNPTKPIGQFMSREGALKAARERNWTVREDASRGWRRVVASPLPREIIEAGAIRAMVESGNLVICCGGGGIPVVQQGKHLAGIPAVIDKDFCAALLAEKLNADMLIILTAVEKAAIHFGRPNQQWLDHMTPGEAEEYCRQGQFAPGSMLPKVQAGVQFARSGKGRTTLITLLQKAGEAAQGKTGTTISE